MSSLFDHESVKLEQVDRALINENNLLSGLVYFISSKEIAKANSSFQRRNGTIFQPIDLLYSLVSFFDFAPIMPKEIRIKALRLIPLAAKQNVLNPKYIHFEQFMLSRLNSLPLLPDDLRIAYVYALAKMHHKIEPKHLTAFLIQQLKDLNSIKSMSDKLLLLKAIARYCTPTETLWTQLKSIISSSDVNPSIAIYAAVAFLAVSYKLKKHNHDKLIIQTATKNLSLYNDSNVIKGSIKIIGLSIIKLSHFATSSAQFLEQYISNESNLEREYAYKVLCRATSALQDKAIAVRMISLGIGHVKGRISPSHDVVKGLCYLGKSIESFRNQIISCFSDKNFYGPVAELRTFAASPIHRNEASPAKNIFHDETHIVPNDMDNVIYKWRNAINKTRFKIVDLSSKESATSMMTSPPTDDFVVYEDVAARFMLILDRPNIDFYYSSLQKCLLNKEYQGRPVADWNTLSIMFGENLKAPIVMTLFSIIKYPETCTMEILQPIMSSLAFMQNNAASPSPKKKTLPDTLSCK